MNLSLAKQQLAIVVLLWSWCGALIGYLFYVTGIWGKEGAIDEALKKDGQIDGISALGYGLIWNLFLATIPLICSWIFQRSNAHKRPFVAVGAFVVWLLFFPNAPYLLTDLIHLNDMPSVPMWYVLAILLSCAGAGTLLGYLSLLRVHDVVEQRFGKFIGWGIVGSSLMLSGFGIYLGRFLRWNSWNAFTKPLRLLNSVIGQFIDPYPHPHPVSVTLIFGIGLIIGYLGLRVIAAPTIGNRKP